MEIDRESLDIMKLDEIKHRLAMKGVKQNENPDGTIMKRQII